VSLIAEIASVGIFSAECSVVLGRIANYDSFDSINATFEPAALN
jgi:hypothetical protein